jgi:hypothetical protein
MRPVAFAMLYIVCLGLSLGCVGVLRSVAIAPSESAPTALAASVKVALPPRPEGVRPVHGAGGELFTEKQCLSKEGSLRDICFHHLARQRAAADLPGALLACATVNRPRTRHECTADIAELHARVDRLRALELCPDIPRKKWRDQCVFGIALSTVGTDPVEAFSLCDRAGMWQAFCRHDVNGEIAVVDLPLAMAHCAAEQGDHLTRVSCWHGIGKYIARVDLGRAFAACREVPAGEYRENCAHGLGWAATESGGVAVAKQCDAAGDVADSCRLGVAYNHRRFDVDAALAVCSTVLRADLRARCEVFASTGVIGSSG